MSTRACYRFFPLNGPNDWPGVVTVYKHRDGYPSGAAQAIDGVGLLGGQTASSRLQHRIGHVSGRYYNDRAPATARLDPDEPHTRTFRPRRTGHRVRVRPLDFRTQGPRTHRWESFCRESPRNGRLRPAPPACS